MFVRQERNTDTPYQTYQYTIPNIFDYLEEEEGSNNDSKSGNNNLRINPLGAGDTCSGVFTMKYIELKVYFFIRQIIIFHKHIAKNKNKNKNKN